MAKKRSPTSPQPVWLSATVVAAAISAVALVVVALINSQTGDDESPTAKAGLSVVSVGSQALAPPPRVKYVFAGAGVTGDDDVYILGKYVPSHANPPEPRTEISPRGLVKANGTWTVEWTFSSLPTLADFTAFTVASSSVCAELLVCGSPPPVSSTWATATQPTGTWPSGTATRPSDSPLRLNAVTIDRLLRSQGWRGSAIRAAVPVDLSPVPLPRTS